MEWPDDRYQKLRIYVWKLIFDSYEWTQLVCVTLQCMILA